MRIKVSKPDKKTVDILIRNPVLYSLLGITAVITATTRLIDALAMSVILIAALVITAVVSAVMRDGISHNVKIWMRALVPAAVVTAAEAVMSVYYPEIYASLGIYLPLAATSTLIIAYSDSDMLARRDGTALDCAFDAAAAGLGFTAVAVITAFIRELFGRGELFGFVIFPDNEGMPLLLMPAGAFILLGILSAVLKYVLNRIGGGK